MFDDMFNEIRTKMGKYGVRPSDTVYVTDANTFIRALSIGNFRTLGKFGPQATVLTGQLGAVEGMPVIVSELMKLAGLSRAGCSSPGRPDSDPGRRF